MFFEGLVEGVEFPGKVSMGLAEKSKSSFKTRVSP